MNKRVKESKGKKGMAVKAHKVVELHCKLNRPTEKAKIETNKMFLTHFLTEGEK